MLTRKQRQDQEAAWVEYLEITNSIDPRKINKVGSVMTAENDYGIGAVGTKQLVYYTKFFYKTVVHETKKAILFDLCYVDDNKYSIKQWVPKAACGKIYQNTKAIWIDERFAEKELGYLFELPRNRK